MLGTFGLIAIGAVLISLESGPAKGVRMIAIFFLMYGVLLLSTVAQGIYHAYGAKGRGYDVPRVFQFSPAGVEIRVQGFDDTSVPWEAIQRVVRRNGFTFLHYSQNGHWPVPDDAFRSPDDLRAFQSILKARGVRMAGGWE